MRLFIAVNLPEAVKEAVDEIQDKLRRSGGDVKWVEKENFHLTIKFLGETSDEIVPEIKAAVRESVRGITPFKLSFSGIGAFPSSESPRVIWLGVNEGAQALERIAAGLENSLKKLGFDREKRPFSAHLTLGRVRSARNRETLVKKINELAGSAVGAVQIKTIDIMQSYLSPHGPRYECLDSI